ncbi:nitrate reductase cytochrome c-type subunit [Halieaceae bacterium IMCC14734]|uniref:Periplasmic nitrate reductase, electron transfer subunit n=1 Tax=Candidatus Litorirhabdus singularis TaxID=2518993 RepID=A0ABT3THL0_9GAMM|nr:nitrate reductase cytochrome c-type subunit [Candidatus Litorirhabdus singularis]MCX2981818.1 nitrate reductase cytochrome c-type subunit [Candidatus Litorirhabdus singularis]
MKNVIAVLSFLLLTSLTNYGALAEERLITEGGQTTATLRNGPIDEEASPPKMSKVENNDIKRKRAYPMQPPTIPHKIDGYQVDLKVNTCMSCHSRKRTAESQAPMVSVTHYMDREGNFLADVSPRRYFCEQCHVTQAATKPLIGNDFIDIDQLINNDSPKSH